MKQPNFSAKNIKKCLALARFAEPLGFVQIRSPCFCHVAGSTPWRPVTPVDAGVAGIELNMGSADRRIVMFSFGQVASVQWRIVLKNS